MNYLGVDIYAHNRGTRRYARSSTDVVPEKLPVDCPFCGASIYAFDNRLAEHVERGGFTRCPGSGVQPYIAAQRAASMTADYRLPCEGGMDD